VELQQPRNFRKCVLNQFEIEFALVAIIQRSEIARMKVFIALSVDAK